MNTKRITIGIIIIAAVLCMYGGSGAAASGKTTFTDKRDGKTYRKVTIGAQTWMAENLNYAADGSVCYKNEEGNCAKYGRLYDWNAALTACPSGWHLSRDDEWMELVNYVDGASTPATSYADGGRPPVGALLFAESKRLKSTSGWDNNGNGTDDYGFSALPGGHGKGHHAGYYGYWWSAAEDKYDTVRAYIWLMISTDEKVIRHKHFKTSQLSVRCVQDITWGQ